MRDLVLRINGTPIPVPSTVPNGGFYPILGPFSPGMGEAASGQVLIQIGINLLFLVGIILGVIFVILSGIQWILSGGDKQKIESARGRLTYSIIGLLVIAASFLIVRTVISLIGGNPNFFLNTGGP